MRKAIIFGADGQDGRYLSSLLEKEKILVSGIGRPGSETGTDITDFISVTNLVKDHQPEFIFHLAAHSTTQHDALFTNHQVIATGTLNILEAVKNVSPHSTVFISGSGLQFKNENKPIKESDPFEARDAYSVSRIQSVYAARYFRRIGIKAYTGYFFNHDSPLRTEAHLSKRIAEAAKRIGAGSKEKLEIGDLDAVKEYSFAGDIVKGIWTLVKQDKISEANISSGKGYSVREWLKECFAVIGKDWKEYVTENPGFVAPYKKLISDPSLVFSLGWRPEVSFSDLAKMMMRE